jgi:SAM-dependent methyltransferase
MQLLNSQELEQSSVVANCAMNRERQLTGPNSYERELGFDILQFLQSFPFPVTWVDLCCGTGRDLIQAAEQVEREAPGHVQIEGIDLAGMFAENPVPGVLTLHEQGLEAWQPTGPYALVTCIHGLHYVGDKLAAIAKAAAKLQPNGLFIASLDLSNFRHGDGQPAGRAIAAQLRSHGFTYDTRRHLLSCQGPRVVDFELQFELQYLGANTEAGPNYTGQPAIDSYYRLSNETTSEDRRNDEP